MVRFCRFNIWVRPYSNGLTLPLVCDAYPAGLDQFLKPVSFLVKGLSANAISTPATQNPDGTLQLHYDLSQLGHGSYTVVVDAVNVLGGVSPDSLPFQFVSGVPGAPTNIRITP